MDDISSDIINNFDIDTFKFGTAQTTENFFIKNLKFFDGIKITILTMLGFGIYNLIIANIINTNHITHYNIKLAVDDILKFGTVYVFLRLMSGQPFHDKEWISEVLFTLIGFITYDFLTIHVIDTEKMEKEDTITAETKLAINDVIKFSTMLFISRILSGKEFTKEWLSESFGFIIGLVAYDYLLSNMF